MAFVLDGFKNVVDFVHEYACGPANPPAPPLALPTDPAQVARVAQPIIGTTDTPAAQTPPPPVVHPQQLPPLTQAPHSETLRRRRRTSAAAPTPPPASPAPRSWLSIAGSLVKGTVLLPFKALYKTAALTATVAGAVYRNATFRTVASPTLAYLARNYTPATVEWAAASVGAVTGYTPPTAVVASAAGYLAACTASKAVPAVYRSAKGYVTEKMRVLPPALARAGLNKDDISLKQAATIATLPAANQTALGQALVLLRTQGILTPETSNVLLSSKFPRAVANAMVLLHPTEALKDCIEILKHSEDPISLARIFTLLLRSGYNIHPFFTALEKAPADSLRKIVPALEALQAQHLPSQAASALIASQNPEALAKIFLTLKAANLYLLPLIQKNTICDPKQAASPELEELAMALECLRTTSSARAFKFFVQEVLDSNTPAALASSIVLLKDNSLLTQQTMATLVQYTNEVSQIITLLSSEGMLTNPTYTAIMMEEDPLDAATKQTIARAQLRQQQTLAQKTLSTASISSAAAIEAVNRSHDPQRLALALVKLSTLGKLNSESRAEMVRLDSIYRGADDLNQLADEMGPVLTSA